MTRVLRPSSLLMLGCLLLAACGGVARNPSEPQFPQKGSSQQGGQPGQGTAGQGGNLTPEQDPNLSGATTPEDFRDRAQVALLQGNLVTGVNGYTKMVELKPDDPQAALGLAVATLWRDADEFGPFTGTQLPLTFYNTPLSLVPTLVPQPLAQEDGYLWRLLALSIDSQPGLDPQQLLADFLTEAGVKTGAAPGGRPQPAELDPEVAERLQSGTLRPGGDRKEGADEGRQAEREKEKEARKGGEGESADTEGDRSRGGQSAGDPGRSGQQLVSGVAGTDEGGTESKGADTGLGGARDARNPGGEQRGGVPTAGGQPAGTQNPAAVLSQTTYVDFDRDRVGQELLPKLKTWLAQRSALSFTWEGRSAKLNQLRTSIDGLLTAMDRSKDKVKDEFHLELPVRLGTTASPQVHKIAFEKADYEMVHQQLKLMKWLLDYRSQYTTAGQWNFLVPAKDADADGALSPAEYYPAAPFGTLTQSSKDTLRQMQSQLGEILRDMGEAMQEYRDAEIYTTSNKNYLLPRALDQTLETSVLLAEYDRILEVSLALPQEEAQVKLLYTRDGEALTVKYAPLFDGSLDDVRKLLPAFDPVSRAIMPQEGLPADLMPTVLPVGTMFEPWINRSLTVDGLIIKSGLPLVKATVTAGTASAETAELTGMFSLANVALAPLVGMEITISGAGLAEPVVILTRTPNIAWDVSLPIQHAAGGAGTPTSTAPEGMITAGGVTASGELIQGDVPQEGDEESRSGLLGGLQGKTGTIGGGEDKPDEDSGEQSDADGSTGEQEPENKDE